MKGQSTINEPLSATDIIPKDILVESSTNSILVNITKKLDRYSVEGWNRRRMKYSSLAKGHARYSISSYNFDKGYRNTKNVKGFGQVLLLDFDKGRPTLEEAIESVKNAGLRAVICPSKSHQKQKNDEPPCDRLHVILFLNEELHDVRTSSDEVKKIDNSLQTLSAMVFDGAILDDNALGIARFFGATFNEDGIYIDGKVIDSQKFLSLADLTSESIEDSKLEEDDLSSLIKKNELDSFYSNYPEIEWSIKKFNNPKSLKKILEKDGYTYSGKNGNEYRLFRPDHTSDKPSVVIRKNDNTGSWYVYHHSGDLQGKTLDAFGLIKELRFNGDFKWAQAYTLKRYEESQPETTLDNFVNTFTMSQKDLDKMSKEEINVKANVLFAGQVCVLIARPNGGKTLLAKTWSIQLAKDGYKVIYLYEDADMKGYVDMSETASQYGFSVLSSFANVGKTAEDIINMMDKLGGSTDLNKVVFIVDTLKKFTELLDKSANKKFFAMLRKLTSKGASILLLGHANKYLDENGLLIFEGTNDVKADVDSLYYMYDDGNKHSEDTRYATLVYEKGRAISAVKEKSYKLDLTTYTAIELDEVVDTKTLAVKYQLLESHSYEVSVVKQLVQDEPKNQKELLDILANEIGMTRRQAVKMLHSLEGMCWRVERGGARNISKIFYPLDYEPPSAEEIDKIFT